MSSPGRFQTWVASLLYNDCDTLNRVSNEFSQSECCRHACEIRSEVAQVETGSVAEAVCRAAGGV